MKQHHWLAIKSQFGAINFMRGGCITQPLLSKALDRVARCLGFCIDGAIQLLGYLATEGDEQ